MNKADRPGLVGVPAPVDLPSLESVTAALTMLLPQLREGLARLAFSEPLAPEEITLVVCTVQSLQITVQAGCTLVHQHPAGAAQRPFSVQAAMEQIRELVEALLVQLAAYAPYAQSVAVRFLSRRQQLRDQGQRLLALLEEIVADLSTHGGQQSSTGVASAPLSGVSPIFLVEPQPDTEGGYPHE